YVTCSFLGIVSVAVGCRDHVRDEPAGAVVNTPLPVRDAAPDTSGMIWIPGGEAQLGSQEGSLDAPLHRVQLSGFWMDAVEVSNAEFAKFAAATGYVTDAERKPTAADVPGVP